MKRAVTPIIVYLLLAVVAPTGASDFPPGVTSVSGLAARALYAGNPQAVGDLGVHWMRRGRFAEAAHAYATALRRARFFQQSLDDVRDNIGAFRDRLRQTSSVPERVRRQCTRVLAQAEADLEQADMPTFEPVEDVYARHEAARAARVSVNSHQPPTMSQHVNGRDGFFRFLKSDLFRKKYFERWPVVLHMSGMNNFTHLLPLAQFLDQQYTFGMDKYEKGHANFHMVKGSFMVQHPTLRFPAKVSRAEIEQEVIRGNFTGFTHGTQLWVPSVLKFSTRVAKVTGREVNTNTYVTGPGKFISMSPHNDMQCTLIVQLHGIKRWRVWVVDSAMLPVDERHVYGKDEGKVLDSDRLGEPDVDVTLQPGDVLYVPRGAIHATSTVVDMASTENRGEEQQLCEDDSNDGRCGAQRGFEEQRGEPSLHLTVGIEARIGQTYGMSRYHFLGGLPNKRPGTKALLSHLHHALARVASRDIEMRRGISRKVIRAGKQHALSARLPIPPSKDKQRRHRPDEGDDDWKEDLRALMHKVVDELFDGTKYAEESAAELYRSLVKQLKRRKAAGEFTEQIQRSPRATFGEEVVLR